MKTLLALGIALGLSGCMVVPVAEPVAVAQPVIVAPAPAYHHPRYYRGHHRRWR
ncbi:MAG TPA: hypothetical protein VM489_15030 [Burkholderiales bacterium]|jgi:hypothetical protein|nr:hypothetical protein [Burkholderiales bacterium]